MAPSLYHTNFKLCVELRHVVIVKVFDEIKSHGNLVKNPLALVSDLWVIAEGSALLAIICLLRKTFKATNTRHALQQVAKKTSVGHIETDRLVNTFISLP